MNVQHEKISRHTSEKVKNVFIAHVWKWQGDEYEGGCETLSWVGEKWNCVWDVNFMWTRDVKFSKRKCFS